MMRITKKKISPFSYEQSFVLNEDADINPVICAFVRTAREFAKISAQELARRVQNSGLTDPLRSGRYYHREVMQLDTKGKINTTTNLSTLIAISHACGLNLDVMLTPKDIDKDGICITSPFPILGSYNHNTSLTPRDIHALCARSLFEKSMLALGLRTIKELAEYTGDKEATLRDRTGIGSSKLSNKRFPHLSHMLDFANSTDSYLSFTLCVPDKSPTLKRAIISIKQPATAKRPYKRKNAQPARPAAEITT